MQNALRYEATDDTYKFAVKYLGVRRAYFEISKDNQNNVEGRIFEFLGIDGSFSTSSAAEFQIDDNYVSVVGNKSSSMMGWTGTINELYNVNSGKLLGYEVQETFSSITYNSLWFNLGDTWVLLTLNVIPHQLKIITRILFMLMAKQLCLLPKKLVVLVPRRFLDVMTLNYVNNIFTIKMEPN